MEALDDGGQHESTFVAPATLIRQESPVFVFGQFSADEARRLQKHGKGPGLLASSTSSAAPGGGKSLTSVGSGAPSGNPPPGHVGSLDSAAYPLAGGSPPETLSRQSSSSSGLFRGVAKIATLLREISHEYKTGRISAVDRAKRKQELLCRGPDGRPVKCPPGTKVRVTEDSSGAGRPGGAELPNSATRLSGDRQAAYGHSVLTSAGTARKEDTKSQRESSPHACAEVFSTPTETAARAMPAAATAAFAASTTPTFRLDSDVLLSAPISAASTPPQLPEHWPLLASASSASSTHRRGSRTRGLSDCSSDSSSSALDPHRRDWVSPAMSGPLSSLTLSSFMPVTRMRQSLLRTLRRLFHDGLVCQHDNGLFRRLIHSAKSQDTLRPIAAALSHLDPTDPKGPDSSFLRKSQSTLSEGARPSRLANYSSRFRRPHHAKHHPLAPVDASSLSPSEKEVFNDLLSRLCRCGSSAGEAARSSDPFGPALVATELKRDERHGTPRADSQETGGIKPFVPEGGFEVCDPVKGATMGSAQASGTGLEPAYGGAGGPAGAAGVGGAADWQPVQDGASASDDVCPCKGAIEEELSQGFSAGRVAIKLRRHYLIKIGIGEDIRVHDAILGGAPRFLRPMWIQTWFVPAKTSRISAFRTSMGPGSTRLYDEPNAGGSSVNSEALSMEILAACCGARLWQTELEVEYSYTSSIIDYSCVIGDVKCGVSVTRAMKYAGGHLAFTEDDAEHLLTKKLRGLKAATLAAKPSSAWSVQILHIWAQSDFVASVLRRVLERLPHSLWETSIILVTVSADLHHIIFKNAEFEETPPAYDPDRERKERERMRAAERGLWLSLSGHSTKSK